MSAKVLKKGVPGTEEERGRDQHHITTADEKGDSRDNQVREITGRRDISCKSLQRERNGLPLKSWRDILCTALQSEKRVVTDRLGAEK